MYSYIKKAEGEFSEKRVRTRFLQNLMNMQVKKCKDREIHLIHFSSEIEFHSSSSVIIRRKEGLQLRAKKPEYLVVEHIIKR